MCISADRMNTALKNITFVYGIVDFYSVEKKNNIDNVKALLPHKQNKTQKLETF